MTRPTTEAGAWDGLPQNPERDGTLPATLTDDQRRIVWLAQYRLANARLSRPAPDSACAALAEERVASAGQRESDIAAWMALRETLLPEHAAAEREAGQNG